MKKIETLEVGEVFIDPDFGALLVTAAPVVRGPCVDIQVDGAPSHYALGEKVVVLS